MPWLDFRDKPGVTRATFKGGEGTTIERVLISRSHRRTAGRCVSGPQLVTTG
jgi:hypothetical protein